MWFPSQDESFPGLKKESMDSLKHWIVVLGCQAIYIFFFETWKGFILTVRKLPETYQHSAQKRAGLLSSWYLPSKVASFSAQKQLESQNLVSETVHFPPIYPGKWSLMSVSPTLKMQCQPVVVTSQLGATHPNPSLVIYSDSMQRLFICFSPQQQRPWLEDVLLIG